MSKVKILRGCMKAMKISAYAELAVTVGIVAVACYAKYIMK